MLNRFLYNMVLVVFGGEWVVFVATMSFTESLLTYPGGMKKAGKSLTFQL